MSARVEVSEDNGWVEAELSLRIEVAVSRSVLQPMLERLVQQALAAAVPQEVPGV